MSYIGTPPSNAFTSLLKQDFSTSATTGYTLDHAVNNANDIALFINFVRQEPTAGYAASGTTLTLTSATASSDDMYCVYLGQALQTVNPPNASVGLSQLTATGTKDSTTFLRGDNTFAVAAGDNTPSFGATMSANQTNISSATNTLVAFNTETWDTDSAYTNTSGNYKFTVPSGQAGKYMLTAHLHFRGDATFSGLDVRLYKNGSFLAQTKRNSDGNYLWSAATNNIEINSVQNLSESDYIQVYGQALGTTFDIMEEGAYFSAYKLIGV